VRDLIAAGTANRRGTCGRHASRAASAGAAPVALAEPPITDAHPRLQPFVEIGEAFLARLALDRALATKQMQHDVDTAVRRAGCLSPVPAIVPEVSASMIFPVTFVSATCAANNASATGLGSDH
jgi:hypothetical protein